MNDKRNLLVGTYPANQQWGIQFGIKVIEVPLDLSYCDPVTPAQWKHHKPQLIVRWHVQDEPTDI